ncbi:MAG: hypothetical protein ACYCS1_04225 [Gammaproteobacteria bacterium]
MKYNLIMGILAVSVIIGMVNAQPPSLSITSTNVAYGVQDTITANQTSGNVSDVINLYINGTLVNSTANSTSFTICSTQTISACYGAGSWNVTAVDTALLGNNSTTNTITINQDVLTISVSSSPSNCNFVYSGANCQVTATISTIGNQTNFSMWLTCNTCSAGNAYNNMLSATGGTTDTLTNIQATTSNYAYVFNDTGNQNYSTATNNYTYSITQATPSLTLTVPSSFMYNGNGGLVNFSTSSFDNQVLVTLKVNGVNVATTTTSGSYLTDSHAQTYDVILSSPNSLNYSAGSISKQFTIIALSGGSFFIYPNSTVSNLINTPNINPKNNNSLIFTVIEFLIGGVVIIFIIKVLTPALGDVFASGKDIIGGLAEMADGCFESLGKLFEKK